MQKTIHCPYCGKTTTITSEPGETKNFTCPSCGKQEKISFENITTGQKLVTISNVSKKYKDILALNNASFQINKGEIFGYIGPNGAGKTTTIKIMVGLLNKTSGQLFINEYQMPEQKEEAHRFIGYMPQEVAFQKWRTVNHALTTFGKLSGMNKNIIDSRIDEILTLLNLSQVKNKKINKLSGGMIQKLGIAQALLHKPPLLILDEPLSGLDPESRYQVKKILKELSKEGTTVFFSSHILSDVQDLATKICILDWGRILKIGSLNELKSEFSKEHQIEIILSKKSDKYREIEKISGIQKIFEKSAEKILVNIEKTADVDDIIHNIITTLLENKCRIRSITSVSPSLDEIYQYYLRKGLITQ
jgi:ABC-type multidrug transport system ATPase subunit